MANRSQPPYRPFTKARARFDIGLRPLDLDDWIEMDADHGVHLAEKEEVIARHGSNVVAALPDSEDAQAEVLALLGEFLPTRFPKDFARDGDVIEVRSTGVRHSLKPRERMPIDVAGRLVQEDLCIMAPGDEGYVLTAASLAAPAHWRLMDKIGRPMAAIHGPVPGWADGMGARVDRIFGQLKVEMPVWRLNWSIVETDTRYTPVRRPRTVADQDTRLWLRVERQTLRRLPRTGAILFTIRTYIEPLEGVAIEDGMAEALIEAVDALGAAERAYKQLDAVRARLTRLLSASGGHPGNHADPGE